MSYLGDYPNDFTALNFKFNTRQFTTGAPFALVGGVISVYKNNDATQSTAGITLTTPFDSVVGMSHVLIDLSSDVFYALASEYDIVLTAGTVDGVSVAGSVLKTFSIERAGGALALLKDPASGLAQLVRATTPGNKMDVEAGGTVGIDWGNIANKTTTNDLSSTTIGTVTAFSTAAILSIWDQLTSALSTASTIGKLLVDNINATISSRMAEASINTTGGKVDGVILVDTTTSNTDMRGTDSAATAAALATVDGKLPSALVGGKMDSDATAISGSTDAADNLEASAKIIFESTVTGSPSITQIVDSALGAIFTNDDILIDSQIMFGPAGSANGSKKDITDYDVATNTITFVAVANAPTIGDTYVIV